jgi:uncharacterized protein
MCVWLPLPQMQSWRILTWERGEAIQLAEEQHADLLLIDERKGRRRARQRGLKTTGTLGVLLSAGELRLIDPGVAYRQLQAETTFRTSAELEAQFLALIRPSV